MHRRRAIIVLSVTTGPYPAPAEGAENLPDEIANLTEFFRKQGLPTFARDSAGGTSLIRSVPALVASFPTALWHGVRAVWANKGEVVSSAVRETPVVLVVLILLFMTTEVWQLLGRIGAGRFLVVCALVLVLGVIMLWLALDAELKTLFQFSTRSQKHEVHEAASGTPAEPLRDKTTLPECRRIERFRLDVVAQLNIRLVMFAPILMLVLLVGLSSFVFICLFGVVALDQGLTTHWVHGGAPGPPPAHVWSIPIAPGGLVLTDSLIRVSVLLASIAALVFAVDVLREPEVKKKLMGKSCDTIRQAIAAWVYYKQALEERRTVAG